MFVDLASQDRAEGGSLGLLLTVISVRVGKALEDLAALSKCNGNGRGRRRESCLERRRFVGRQGGVS